MTLLILGLILWVGAHFFKRLMPEKRAAMGDAGRLPVTIGIVVALLLIIIGYRMAEFIPVWNPPSFFTHINNLAMLIALWVFGSSAAKGAKAWPAYTLRHPQLVAVAFWAVAHLLVNGDLASILLFGAMLAWSGVTMLLINQAEPDWTPPPPAGRATYIRLAVIATVLFVIISGVHVALGVSPFPT
ncbi:hypothetical protein C1J03_18195 [Sulfitobacter sp. SK012]|uniref:NnrU family protein n=1 Tax=Sulfitobacter sp. SK012 TaxID=1389005 RepID=UPI000E0BAA56|nr:NnrU family protein [Sulfitobacter sp. SK012]AXI47767.1 hypothetical protein C1J03_18195 [Sulfitobacter sp. SK012]